MQFRSIIIVSLFLAGLLVGGCASTSQTVSSNQPAQKKVLNAPTPHVQALIDKYQLEVVDYEYVKEAIGNGSRKGARALLLDARPHAKYLKGTIPSSLNLPDTQIDKYISQLDGVDLNREIIVFCGGWSCKKSPIVADYLQNKGYTDVKLYIAGVPEWKKNNFMEVGIPVVQSAVKNNSALLMDARPRLKYLAETIPGAMYMLNTELDKLAGRLPADKKTPIIVFCGGYSCSKSHSVAERLIALGYHNVKVFAAGLPAWKKAGLKTTACAKGAVAATESEQPKEAVFVDGVKVGVDEGTVDGEWLYALIKQGKLPQNIVLYDVRDTADHKAGHIAGSKHIFAEELSAQELNDQLPKDKIVIFSCGSGARAMEAYFKLKDAKLDVSKRMYFDANINCEGDKCEIEVNEPLG